MKLGIFGSGGFGREVLECVKQILLIEKKWDEVFFIDDVNENGSENGFSVYKYNYIKERYGYDEIKIFVALGEPASRKKITEMIIEDGYMLETIIHPNVWIPDTTMIGAGSYIASSAFISCNVSIGNSVLVMSLASIGHDTSIGNYCVCSGQSNVAGHCIIEDYAFLGLNCIIRENVRIAQWTIVSAGSAVLKSVEEPEFIVAGVPARKMQRNESHRVF